MSIWITGDCHGGFQRFTQQNFPQQKEMGWDDYVIICGDFGGVWSGERADGAKLDWLEDKPFTTLFVDGNHENFGLLSAYPEQNYKTEVKHHAEKLWSKALHLPPASIHHRHLR